MNTDKHGKLIAMSQDRDEIMKELGILLAEIRKKAKLTQKEVGERLGFSGRSGNVYISRLEKGGINNPSLWLILKYLDVCEKPWPAFFQELSAIYFNKQHNKIIAQVPTTRFYQKVDRDVAKYTHSIQTKFSEKQNLKPLTQEKKDKMSVEFGKHRAVIEQIEREITSLLGNTSEPIINNQYYKAFAREVHSILKKITTKARNSKSRWDEATSKEETTKEFSAILASSTVNMKLNQIIEKWVKKGLKREILEQVKEIPIKYLKPQAHTDGH